MQADIPVPPPNVARIPIPETAAQELPPLIPALAYRHASPSGPWPWLDLEYDAESHKGSPDTIRGIFPCPHTQGECNEFEKCWSMYPQNLFPNWTPGQVKRSRIVEAASQSRSCTVYVVDVDTVGRFYRRPEIVIKTDNLSDHLKLMRVKRPPKTLVRTMFMDNLSVPVMEGLGTKYKIEPFYFSSSLNRIPSRYQESVNPGEGDHITVTMSFMRLKKVPEKQAKKSPSFYGERVDDQLALVLKSDNKFCNTLIQEVLAIHLIRDKDSSTLISYHAPNNATSAEQLQTRVALAGGSVYWQNIFQQSDDPTLLLLIMFWYALYAWDESLAALWDYIGQLEIAVLTTHNISFTQELHKIRAHLLYYVALLEDFKNAIIFVRDTPNPVMDSWSEEDRARSLGLMQRESKNLLQEIDRLVLSRQMQDDRLKNVMDLAFSSVSAEDSTHAARLSELSLKDSAVMKQISYLTMVFLPASFVSSVFGMNIVELVSADNGKGTLAEYFAVVVPLTAITIWALVALQGRWHTRENEEQPGIITRLCWPFISLGGWAITSWDLARRKWRIRHQPREKRAIDMV